MICIGSPRLPALQHGELVAQDQDLCGLPRVSSRRDSRNPRGDPRNQEEYEPQASGRLPPSGR